MARWPWSLVSWFNDSRRRFSSKPRTGVWQTLESSLEHCFFVFVKGLTFGQFDTLTLWQMKHPTKKKCQDCRLIDVDVCWYTIRIVWWLVILKFTMSKGTLWDHHQAIWWELQSKVPDINQRPVWPLPCNTILNAAATNECSHSAPKCFEPWNRKKYLQLFLWPRTLVIFILSPAYLTLVNWYIHKNYTLFYIMDQSLNTPKVAPIQSRAISLFLPLESNESVITLDRALGPMTDIMIYIYKYIFSYIRKAFIYFTTLNYLGLWRFPRINISTSTQAG